MSNPRKIEYSINKNGCHICTSHCLDWAGYPWIRRGGEESQHMSRYLWKQAYGSIPEGLCVLHKCDTPACINLEHLFLGTNIDNIKDKVSKNRQSHIALFGEKNGNHKLTKEQVLQIHKEFGTQREIAEKYGVSRAMISLIKNKKNWRLL